MENQLGATKKKVGVVAYIWLIVFILMFSGVLKGVPYLGTFDFANLVGKFGIVKGAEGNFQGTGGTGADQGFMLCLGLIPTLMLSLGLVEVAQAYGALDAAGVLLTPLLRFLLNVPGCMALSLVGSLNSSDVGAVTTKDLYDSGMISDDERTRMIAFQYPGCGLIVNLALLYSMGGDNVLISMSAYMLIIIALKFVAANIMRLFMKTKFYRGSLAE